MPGAPTAMRSRRRCCSPRNMHISSTWAKAVANSKGLDDVDADERALYQQKVVFTRRLDERWVGQSLNMGDPRLATAEHGNAILERCVEVGLKLNFKSSRFKPSSRRGRAFEIPGRTKERVWEHRVGRQRPTGGAGDRRPVRGVQHPGWPHPRPVARRARRYRRRSCPRRRRQIRIARGHRSAHARGTAAAIRAASSSRVRRTPREEA